MLGLVLIFFVFTICLFSFVGIWRYRIERLGDSHQSHFVQVVTSTMAANAGDEFSVRLYSNVEETRSVNLSQMPLILYAEVKRGMSPVIDAEVEATIFAGTLKWNVRLFDSGNGGELRVIEPVRFMRMDVIKYRML